MPRAKTNKRIALVLAAALGVSLLMGVLYHHMKSPQEHLVGVRAVAIKDFHRMTGAGFFEVAEVENLAPAEIDSLLRREGWIPLENPDIDIYSAEDADRFRLNGPDGLLFLGSAKEWDSLQKHVHVGFDSKFTRFLSADGSRHLRVLYIHEQVPTNVATTRRRFGPLIVEETTESAFEAKLTKVLASVQPWFGTSSTEGLLIMGPQSTGWPHYLDEIPGPVPSGPPTP